jgi:hypothetical protein
MSQLHSLSLIWCKLPHAPLTRSKWLKAAWRHCRQVESQDGLLTLPRPFAWSVHLLPARCLVGRSGSGGYADDIRQAFSASSKDIFRSWVLVPAGILVMLLACFAVDVLLKKISFSFPSSVACLVLLFAALLLSESILGNHRTRKIVAIIDVPVRYPWSS